MGTQSAQYGRTLNVKSALLAVAIGLAFAGADSVRSATRIPESVHNLLVDAQVSGNLESFNQGLRGAVRDMIFDLRKGAFVRASQWHEYGVGFNADLGVVPEDRPAWWMAEWARPVQANLIRLSGTYDNQPQPRTAWKIELRRDGQWTTHARGVKGWYDRGSYTWGGPRTAPLTFDALRVSMFSPDDKAPLKSIHFRGEARQSWIVALCPPVEARIVVPPWPIRAGAPVSFSAEPLLGTIQSWSWDFGDGRPVEGRTVNHALARPGETPVVLQFSDGTHTDRVRRTVTVLPPVEARITPLMEAVMADRPVTFDAGGSVGRIAEGRWDFGDGARAAGPRHRHTFTKPGIYKVTLTVTDGTYEHSCLALVRVHTEQTVRLPQVLLDTDAKNEQDDQHYLGYALFSELDILGINSTHHGGGQEPVNYAEIQHVIDLSRQSGLPEHRVPFVFRGANQRLAVPESGHWYDTEPIPTEADAAILAAARGASPGNPVWIVPVGPGTNPASAILQARREGFDLKDRIRIMWLGGSNNEIINEFNGNNDPWSMYVVCHSGLETWIMPAPVGARVAIDKTKEGHLYADHPLGEYLKSIVPAKNKALFDPSCLSAIISERLGLGWIKQSEPVVVAGPQEGYRWTRTDQPTAVRVIRQIDQKAMQLDLFNTMKGRPTRLLEPAADRLGPGAVISHGPIPGLMTSDELSVRVNGTAVWVEKLTSNFQGQQLPSWFVSQDYTRQPQVVNLANFSCAGPLEVEIRAPRAIETYVIRPKSRRIEAQRDGGTLRFRLPGPDKLYIEIDGLAPLCLFANPPEAEPPSPTAANVLYFGPGVHRAGTITLQDDQTLYLAGGAIVYGALRGSPRRAQVRGRGILDGDYQQRLVQLTGASDVRFEGVILRNGRSWQNTLTDCDRITYENIKVISFGPSGDGINPVGSRDVTIRDCFLRCTDDCIAIKAPQPQQTVVRIRVLDNTMIGFAFSDGLTIGFETNGPHVRDVLMRNCDILIARGGSRVDGHSAFSIICDGPARISEVRFEDIRVEEEVLKLCELHVTDGTKYGKGPAGHIRGVTLQDIRWEVERPIILKGFGAQNLVEDVTFVNCSVAGRPLRNTQDASFETNEHVRGLLFQVRD